MKPRVLKVTFELEAQKTDDGKLTVPLNVVKVLGLAEGSGIQLEMWSHSGLTSGTYQMASGTEVYETSKSNKGLRKAIAKGERLLITASRPAR